MRKGLWVMCPKEQCEEEILVDVTPGHRATFDDDGCGPEVEVLMARCGHGDTYTDKELDLLCADAGDALADHQERLYDAWVDQKIDRLRYGD